jgi:signal transduction histidine kinase
MIDITVLGIAMTIHNAFPSAKAGALAYVLIVSWLLTPRTKAIVTTVYVTAWIGALAIIPPAATTTTEAADLIALIDVAAMGVFMLVTAAVLISVSRALARVHRQFETALETERRAAEIKNEFVSMVSHELRTPLTSISGFTDMLKQSWQDLDPDEVDEFLSIMRQENERLARLVEDILVIPRLESGRLELKFEDFDLRSEAYHLFEVMFPPGSDKETFLVIPGGVQVSCDRMRFEQVLRNLLDNARKYGGDQILIEGERRGDYYEIKVADNGTGIPPQHRVTVFEHFEQLSKGDARDSTGIGLGLPIARKLTRAMGGDLWYEERFPTGAKFCFTVPLATPATDPSATATEGVDGREDVPAVR